MIAAGIHEDYDEPPDIPAFSKNKRARKETMSGKTKARQMQHALLCQLGYYLLKVLTFA